MSALAVEKPGQAAEAAAPAASQGAAVGPASSAGHQLPEHAEEHNHHEKMVQGDVFADDMGDDEDDEYEKQQGHIKNPYMEALFGFGIRIGPVIRYEVGIALLSLLLALVGFIFRGACTEEAVVRTSCSVFGTHIGDWLRFIALSLFMSIPGRLLDKFFFALVAYVSENLLNFSFLDQFFFWVGSLEGAISRFWWIGITWSYADMVTPAATPSGSTPPIQDAMRALWVMQALAVLRNVALRLMLRNVLIGSFEQAINDVLFQQAALLSVCNPHHRVDDDGKLRVDKNPAYREIWRMLSATDVRRKLDFVNKTRFRLYDRAYKLVPIGRKEGTVPFAKLAFKRLVRVPDSALVEVDVRSKEQITAGLYEPSLAAAAAASAGAGAAGIGYHGASGTGFNPSGGFADPAAVAGAAAGGFGLPGAYAVDMSGFGAPVRDANGNVVWNPVAAAGAGVGFGAGAVAGGGFVPSAFVAGAPIREEDAADASGGGALTGCTAGDDTTRAYVQDESGASTGPESTPYSLPADSALNGGAASSPQRATLRRATSAGFTGAAAPTAGLAVAHASSTSGSGGASMRPTLAGHGPRGSVAIAPAASSSAAAAIVPAPAVAAGIDDGGYRPLEANTASTSLVARARERANTAFTAIVSAATTLSGFSATGGSAASSDSARDASPAAASSGSGANAPLRSVGSFRGSIAAGSAVRSTDISRANSGAVAADGLSGRAALLGISTAGAGTAQTSSPLAVGISRTSTAGSAPAIAGAAGAAGAGSQLGLSRAPSLGASAVTAATARAAATPATPLQPSAGAVAAAAALSARGPAHHHAPEASGFAGIAASGSTAAPSAAPFFPAGYSQPEETRLQSALAARIMARTSPAPAPAPSLAGSSQAAAGALESGLTPLPAAMSAARGAVGALQPAAAAAAAAATGSGGQLQRLPSAPQQPPQLESQPAAADQQAMASLMSARASGVQQQPRSRSLTAFTFVPPGKEGGLGPSSASGGGSGGLASSASAGGSATTASVAAAPAPPLTPIAEGLLQSASARPRPSTAALFAAHAATRQGQATGARPGEDDDVGLLLTDDSPSDQLAREASAGASGRSDAKPAADSSAGAGGGRARARSGSEGLRRTRSASGSDFLAGASGAIAGAGSASAANWPAAPPFAGDSAGATDRDRTTLLGQMGRSDGAAGAVPPSIASIGRGTNQASVSSLGRLGWLRFRPRVADASDSGSGGSGGGGGLAALHAKRNSNSTSALDDLAARAGAGSVAAGSSQSSHHHPHQQGRDDGSRASTPNGLPARPGIPSGGGGGWLARHPDVSALGTFGRNVGRQVGAWLKEAVVAAITLEPSDSHGGAEEEEDGETTPAAAASGAAGGLHTGTHGSMRTHSHAVLGHGHSSQGHGNAHGLAPTPGSTLSSVPPARRGSLPHTWAAAQPQDRTSTGGPAGSGALVSPNGGGGAASMLRRRSAGVPQPSDLHASLSAGTSSGVALTAPSSLSAAVGVAGASPSGMHSGDGRDTAAQQQLSSAPGAAGDAPPPPPCDAASELASAHPPPPPPPAPLMRKRKKIYPKLTIAHFAAVVDPRNLDPERVFALFDSNADMAVSIDEFIESVETLWVNLRSVKASISGHQSVSTALNALLNTLFWMAVLLSTLFIFDIPVLQVLVPLGTVLVSASFAIGSSISAVVSSLIFVLVTRPYNVGDRVTCSGVFNGEETL